MHFTGFLSCYIIGNCIAEQGFWTLAADKWLNSPARFNIIKCDLGLPRRPRRQEFSEKMFWLLQQANLLEWCFLCKGYLFLKMEWIGAVWYYFPPKLRCLNLSCLNCIARAYQNCLLLEVKLFKQTMQMCAKCDLSLLEAQAARPS